MPIVIILSFAAILTIEVLNANSAHGQLERLRKNRQVEQTAPAETPMVEIPAGTFVMGSDGAQALEDERPAHHVWLDAYSIDRYEVTTSQYAIFLAQQSRPVPWL